MKLFLLSLIFVLALFSCKTRNLFHKSTPHESYAGKLKDAGLDQTYAGKEWLSAANHALNRPDTVSIPYARRGYFSSDKPRAVAIRFTAKRGQKLFFNIERKSSTELTLFYDLWHFDNGKLEHLEAPDTSLKSFDIEVDETADYIFRIQPQLMHSGEYHLKISIGPSLAFPVKGGSSKIGSFWGDDRDGGRRSHEGIDIFAPGGTPVVAATNGRIYRVEETPVGGKVVWLRPSEKRTALYYAHLDEQLVQDGASVKAGDTIGRVGNTGNARSTPPHLHFGIYVMGGAVDPLPFVDRDIKQPKPIAYPGFVFGEPAAIARKGARDAIVPVDVDHQKIYTGIPFNSAVTLRESQVIDNQYHITIKASIALVDFPSPKGAAIRILEKGDKVAVVGKYKEYLLVTSPAKGWIPASQD